MHQEAATFQYGVTARHQSCKTQFFPYGLFGLIENLSTIWKPD